MKAKLFCKTGILSGKAIDIREAATIGKSADSDLELDAQFISNQHARIYFDKNENCYFLEDLHSRNGTKLDGLKVTQKEKLGNLHVITFAENFDFIFQLVEDDAQRAGDQRMAASQRDDELAQSPSREATPRHAAAPSIGRTILDDAAFTKMPDLEKSTAKDLQEKDMHRTIPNGEFGGMPFIPEAGSSKKRTALDDQGRGRTIAGDAAFPGLQSQKSAGTSVNAGPEIKTQAPPMVYLLEVKITGKEKQSIRLNDGENVVGRSSDCAIFIDDPSLSRRHAVLMVKSGRVMVRDLGSKNHTFIDKRVIASEVEVRAESKLQFGTVEALVRKA